MTLRSIRQRELFYACDCVITEVATEVNTEDQYPQPNQVCDDWRDPAALHQGTDYLLQEHAERQGPAGI